MSFHRCDEEIREVSAAVVAHPQANLATIELAKLPHFERGLIDWTDVDLQSAAFNHHTELDPLRRPKRCIDRVLELLREVLAKAVIVERRQRDVLDRVLLA